jgi:hypothetical protein
MASAELLTSPPLERSVIVVDSSDDEEVGLRCKGKNFSNLVIVQGGDRKRRRRTTVDTGDGMYDLFLYQICTNNN